MMTDEQRTRAFAETFVDWARPMLAKVNADPTGVFLFDQARAEVRERMKAVGLDPKDPVVITTWFEALDCFMVALATCKGDVGPALTMALLTGVMGVQDGDSGSGT